MGRERPPSGCVRRPPRHWRRQMLSVRRRWAVAQSARRLGSGVGSGLWGSDLVAACGLRAMGFVAWYSLVFSLGVGFALGGVPRSGLVFGRVLGGASWVRSTLRWGSPSWCPGWGWMASSSSWVRQGLALWLLAFCWPGGLVAAGGSFAVLFRGCVLAGAWGVLVPCQLCACLVGRRGLWSPFSVPRLPVSFSLFF